MLTILSMNNKLKLLAQKTVDRIYRKIRKTATTEFHKFGMSTDIGADGTPTKYIDKIAEEVAVRCIKNADVKVNLLSEEAGFIDFHGDYTFILDPIDGTRNACRGIPFYSVSLGIGQLTLNDVEYGLVKNISTGDIFVAEKNGGAFLNKKRIFVPDFPGKTLLSSLALGKNIDAKTLSLVKKGIVRSLGSASLEMCMVAIGAFDFYVVGREYLRVTDICAGTLIVREAGGIVTNIRGKHLNMSLTLDDRTSIIVACNEDLVKMVMSVE